MRHCLTAIVVLAFLVTPGSAQEPVSSSSAALFQEIDEVIAELSRITGWKAPRKISPESISKDGLKQFLEARIQEIVKPEEIRAEEIALKKLGLVPEDFDLKKMTIDLLTEQAAAFYDYKKKKLVVLESNMSLMQKPILVHELAHALADAHFNLGKYLLRGKSDDAALSRQAVMEGQATWLMSEYLMVKMGTSLRSGSEMAGMMGRINTSSGAYPVFDAAPLYLRESLLFPYSKGFTFQHAVVLKYGQKAFSEVFRNPPASSQQILHPEKYFSRTAAAKPPLPKADVGGFRPMIEGALGEFDHDVLFRQYGSAGDAALAERWRGAHFQIFEHKRDQRFLLLYASEWEDEKAAGEVFRMYRKVLEGKWKKITFESESESELSGAGDGGRFRVRREGNRVTSVEGL